VLSSLSLFFSLDRLRLRNKCAPAADSFHPVQRYFSAFLQACFSSAIFLRRTSRKRASLCLLLFTYRVFFRECVLRGAFRMKKVRVVRRKKKSCFDLSGTKILSHERHETSWFPQTNTLNEQWKISGRSRATQSLVDDDLELMDFSEEDKVYVRLFVFSLFSSFFFLSPCARAPQTTKQK